jgi:serine/threonine protein kinase
MEYCSSRDYVRYDGDEVAYYTAGSTDAAHADQLDIMSFLSVVAEPDDKRKNWTGRIFLTVHLGPWNTFSPLTPYHGAFFSVTLVRREDILRLTLVDSDPQHLIPGLIAVKTPRLGEEPTSLRNSELFRSIAKEYQILRSEVLRSHENIVTIYGCCWQSLNVHGGRPIPSLILEGTKLGNLVHFSRTRQLTLRERLRICMHISSGLQAIHVVGVVHGDLKPENILVFHSTARGYTAKIADFGEAIPLSGTILPSSRPRGTVLYQAPECYEVAARFSRDELFKTDIFSLGITLASVLQGVHVVDEIITVAKHSASALESLKKSDQFSHWLAALDCRHSEHAAFQDDTGHDEIKDEWVTDPTWRENSLVADERLWLVYLQLLRGLLSANAEQRYRSAEDVLLNLRSMLRLHLRSVLKRPTVISRPNSPSLTPDQGARLGRAIGMSRARLRKLVGVSVGRPGKLKKEEIEAISVSCQSSGGFLREAQFIHKHALTNRNETSRQSRKLRRGRTSRIPKEVLRLAINMMDIAVSRYLRDALLQPHTF